MPKPDFLIIGAQKAGTTWLAHNLAMHPQIHLPPHELHFFDKSKRFSRGCDWYEAQFAPAPGVRAVGEKTPDYLWSEGRGGEDHTPGIAARIHGLYPDLRLICVLRDPVSRAVSAARHLIQTGRVAPDTRLDDLLLGTKAALAAPHGVLEQGCYARHLEAFHAYFAVERMCIIFYEDELSVDPLRVLREVSAFLGVDDDYRFVHWQHRANEHTGSQLGLRLSYHVPLLRPWVRRLDRRWGRPYRPRVSEATLARLRTFYGPENVRLFDLLGRSAPSWQVG
ncbi:MAG: sulfotransferase domain-containing protein [Pseudomonadota bacterium]